jgi:hypothetical protein
MKGYNKATSEAKGGKEDARRVNYEERKREIGVEKGGGKVFVDYEF